MPTLDELIERKRGELVARWERAVRTALTSEGMPEPELLDSLPSFLDGLTMALRANEGDELSCLAGDARAKARVHGTQRLHLGFSVEAVAREYALLREAILGLARDHGVALTHRELSVCMRCIDAGTLEALREYQHQRDAEQRRQAVEHVAFLAHELRNPLSSAVMALGTLKLSCEGAAGKAGQVLERNLAQISDLVDHTLVEHRLRAGVEPALEPVDLEQKLRAVVEESAVDAEARSITLHVSVEHGLTIMADRRLLRSVVTNLVRNAVKFSHRGGDVHVRARASDARVKIEVEDSCGGLPPGAAEMLFDPFVQTGADRSGFGLGLAIARQATEAHGGTLEVHTMPGKGCVFLLDLPRSNDGR